MNAGVWVIVSLLSVFFIFASSVKIFGWQKAIFEIQLQFFKSYGLNRKVMLLVGFVELIGAVLIWFQSLWLAPFGGLILLSVSIAAILFHLIFDSIKNAIPAMVTAFLSGFLLWKGQGLLIDALERVIAFL